MRLIGKKQFGQDKDVECPVFVFNNDEAMLMLEVLKKADVYIPGMFLPQRARIEGMKRCIGDYLNDAGYLFSRPKGKDKALSILEEDSTQ